MSNNNDRELSNIERRSLIKLSQFVLNRETGNARDELQEYIVMSALKSNKENALTRSEILSKIEESLHVERFPPLVVQNAIRRLEEKGNVDRIESPRGVIYSLSEDKSKRLHIMEKEYESMLTLIEKKMILEVEKNFRELDESEKKDIIFNFHRLIGIIFYEYGTTLAREIIRIDRQDRAIRRGIKFASLLKKLLEDVKNEDLRDKIMITFQDLLVNPDENLLNYLYSLAQSYYLFEVLNLDPECQLLTKESFSKQVIYLDTNVIMPLIAPGGYYKSNMELLNLTQNLGIKILISKRTEEELIAHITHVGDLVKNQPILSSVSFDKSSKMLESGLIKEFFKKKAQNPNLTWDGYSSRLKEIKSILERKFSITIDENQYEEIYDLPQMVNVSNFVKLYDPSKPHKVVEHDAYHILLIQKLRDSEESTVLGTNYWFVTYDTTLYDINCAFCDKDQFHYSISVDTWIQMLSPLLSPSVIKKSGQEIFKDLLASRITYITQIISQQDLLLLQGQWMDDEDLGPEDLKKIIGHKFVKDYFKEVRKSPEQKLDPNELNNIMGQVVKDIKSDKKEREMHKEEMERLHAKTIKEIEVYKVKLTGIKVITLISTLIGFILISVLIYSSYGADWTKMGFLWTIGAIIIAILLFYFRTP